MNARPLLVSTLLTAVAGAAVVSLPSAAGADPGRHDRGTSRGVVAEVRKAIAPYRDVAVAEAHGYVPVSPCEEGAEGGMGFHYLNPRLADGAPVDLAQPEVLLYAPRPDGSLQLLGAEYFQPTYQPTDDRPAGAPPTLAGEPFDGPMPGHGGDMPWHYDLHVWTEVANPAGVFAQFNPRVSC